MLQITTWKHLTLTRRNQEGPTLNPKIRPLGTSMIIHPHFTYIGNRVTLLAYTLKNIVGIPSRVTHHH